MARSSGGKLIPTQTKKHIHSQRTMSSRKIVTSQALPLSKGNKR